MITNLNNIKNFALDGPDLPTRVKLFNWGTNDTIYGPIIVNDRTIEVFEANQKAKGYESVALDFNHNTVPDSPEYVKGAAKDIAAYGTPTIIKGDGMYLENIQYTPVGKEKARNYQDLSPAILDEDGVVTDLHSVALTPNGAVKGLTFYSVVSGMGIIQNVDSNTKAGKYGDVRFGDTINKKYPIDTAEHARAAWNYINVQRNADEYNSKELNDIKLRIERACKKFGITTMSSTNNTATITNLNNNMKDKIENKVEETVKVSDEVTTLSAKDEAVKTNVSLVDTNINPLSAVVNELALKIKALEARNEKIEASNEEIQRNSIIETASKEGKFIPLSADSIKIVPINILKELVDKSPKGQVNTFNSTHTISTKSDILIKGKPSQFTWGPSAIK